MKSRMTVAVTLICAAVAVTPVAASAAEAQLKAGFFIGSTKSLFRQAFDTFVERFNAEGKGLATITQVVSTEAVPSRQIPNALKGGVLQVAGAPPSYFSGLVPGAEGFSAAKASAAEQRENGAFALIDDALRERANAHLIAQYGYGVRFHIFTSTPIRTLDDFKGLKLRTSNTYKAFFDALGAQPIQMSRGEIFTAMERGVVQGFANLNSEVAALGWGEVVKYRVDPSFYDTVVFVAVNLDQWKKLSKAQQDFVDSMGRVLETEINADIASRDVAIGDKLANGTFEVVKLPDADSRRYVDLAYESMWDTVEQRAPERGKQLRKLLMK